MKEKLKVADKFIELLCDEFGIEPEDIFAFRPVGAARKARQCLLFLCERRGMDPHEIKRVFRDHGGAIHYTSMRNSIMKAHQRYRDDVDYNVVMSRIEEKCSTY